MRVTIDGIEYEGTVQEIREIVRNPPTRGIRQGEYDEFPEFPHPDFPEFPEYPPTHEPWRPTLTCAIQDYADLP